MRSRGVALGRTAPGGGVASAPRKRAAEAGRARLWGDEWRWVEDANNGASGGWRQFSSDEAGIIKVLYMVVACF